MTDIFLGRIVKAFGIKGELKLLPADDFWGGVLDSKRLRMRRLSGKDVLENPVVIRRSRPHGNNYVIQLDGVDTREAAEGLVGSEFFVAEDQIDVDMPEQLLPFQLMGMSVRSESGEHLGELTSIIYSSAHDVYEVTGDKRSFMVPAVPEFIKSIDESSGTIVVKPLPGLIEE